MHRKKLRQWAWLVIAVFICCGGVQKTEAWDMIPPEESIHRATDEFKQAWRLEAGQKFSEPRRIGANHLASVLMLVILIALLGGLFRRVVKSNHMEQTADKVRSGMLSFYTRMWLVSRWGFRY